MASADAATPAMVDIIKSRWPEWANRGAIVTTPNTSGMVHVLSWAGAAMRRSPRGWISMDRQLASAVFRHAAQPECCQCLLPSAWRRWDWQMKR